MKLLYYIISLIFSITICSFTDSRSEMKKISNQLYSFSIPTDWKCGLGGNVKDCEPVEREERKLYHLYNLQWESPDRNFLMVIQTFQRLDGMQVTIEEIESLIMDNTKQIALQFKLNIFDHY